MFRKKFPHFRQLDIMDCGPTCVRIISRHFGRNFSAKYLRDKSNKGRLGVSMLAISDLSESIGMRSMGIRCSFDMIKAEKPVPFIAHWNQNHFVVVYRITKKYVFVSDPASKKIRYSHKEFIKGWCTTNEDGLPAGLALLVSPTPFFYSNDYEDDGGKVDIRFYMKYLIPHRPLIVQLILGLLVAGVFSLAMPFLTQALVDKGIQLRDMEFVYLILIAQIMVYLGNTTVKVIRDWLMLHISTRINIAALSDFLAKLVRLPISYFGKKNLGDLLMRMGDHRRVEQFLTGESLNFLFSIVQFFVYSAIILTYSASLFGIFILGSVLYFIWVLAFLKQRAKLDNRRFAEASRAQNIEVDLIQGMEEIKLNNCQKRKRWEWEHAQIRLFKVSISNLILEQFQGDGGGFINQLKDIFISFWAAREVIQGNMTLGMMMAATQILGQLSSPIQQFISFIQQGQFALISLERIGEIHNEKEEQEDIEGIEAALPEAGDINLKNVFFRYGNPHSEWILNDINLHIPYGKTTALVGESGSGKTTLLRLLLKFYKPEQGEILINTTNLELISADKWRQKCGTVMQEGFLFSDTIAGNIAISDEDQTPDYSKMKNAVEIANIKAYIERLPLGFNTKIGPEGHTTSTGQKQRIMIARAIYKNPEYLFFDEATSALDARNERSITESINQFKKDRTALIIAHRLSTVKNADQIVVMEKGRIVETGSHQELIDLEGRYFELIKNQLELAGA